MRPRTGFYLYFAMAMLITASLAYLGLFHAPNHVQSTPDLLDKAYRIDRAQVVFTPSYATTHREALQLGPSRSVMLPSNWDQDQPGFTGYAWYTLKVPLTLGKTLPDAVFIPRAVMNVEVYLNGQRIGGVGRMEGELARNWNRPFYFEFASSLLQEEHNVLVIRVAGYNNYRSGLGRVWIGSREALEPVYLSAYRWQVTGSLVASMIALATGVVLLASYLLLPGGQRGLLLLAIAVMLWVVRNIGFYSPWAPLPHALWGQTVHCLHTWFAYFYCLFLLDYMGKFNHWLKHVMLSYAILVTLAIFGMGSDSIIRFTAVMLAPIIPTLLALDLLVIRQSWLNKNPEGLLLGFSSMLFLTLSVRDISASLGLIDYESVLLAQFTGVLLFFSGSAVVLLRYRTALLGLQQSNTRLNSALQKREEQLLQQFSLLQEVEKQRTQDSERRRIMQDIHDGVGSSLVAALNITEARKLTQLEMKQVLQDCLDDLRFAIDSLDPESDDLLALLGNFRWRFERRLLHAKLKLEWRVQEVPKLQGYTSREIFELLRIVQEAFGNVLKHAQADCIRLMVVWDAEQDSIELSILDNGVGMPTGATNPGQGRGLSHMHSRAKAIPAQLQFGPGLDGQGTGVYLRLNRARPARLP